jgi:hypothetical protein
MKHDLLFFVNSVLCVIILSSVRAWVLKAVSDKRLLIFLYGSLSLILGHCLNSVKFCYYFLLNDELYNRIIFLFVVSVED